MAVFGFFWFMSLEWPIYAPNLFEPSVGPFQHPDGQIAPSRPNVVTSEPRVGLSAPKVGPSEPQDGPSEPTGGPFKP